MCPVLETISQPTSAAYSCKLTAMKVDESQDLRYTTYGIAVVDAAGQTLLSYPDISTDQNSVEQFIRIIDSHDVALVHIPDLLEDHLD